MLSVRFSQGITMSVDALAKISDRYQTAVFFHLEAAALFRLLAMPGYAVLHEYQAIDESDTARRLKAFTIGHCQAVKPDMPPEESNLIEPLTGGKRGGFDVMEAVKEAWIAYEKWESDTLALYSKIALDLLDSGDVAAYEFVSCIVKDVSSELAGVRDTITALDGIGWDLPTIAQEQKELAELYEGKIKKLHKEYKNYHHHNSRGGNAE